MRSGGAHDAAQRAPQPHWRGCVGSQGGALTCPDLTGGGDD
jgi:hypothetical protein